MPAHANPRALAPGLAAATRVPPVGLRRASCWNSKAALARRLTDKAHGALPARRESYHFIEKESLKIKALEQARV
jgi:hypothetical protein